MGTGTLPQQVAKWIVQQVWAEKSSNSDMKPEATVTDKGTASTETC
jgi:hypothetical protein